MENARNSRGWRAAGRFVCDARAESVDYLTITSVNVVFRKRGKIRNYTGIAREMVAHRNSLAMRRAAPRAFSTKRERERERGREMGIKFSRIVIAADVRRRFPPPPRCPVSRGNLQSALARLVRSFVRSFVSSSVKRKQTANNKFVFWSGCVNSGASSQSETINSLTRSFTWGEHR